MSNKAAVWEARAQQRADEVSRALIRLGAMTHGQITRLLKVHPQTERDLIKHNWDRFVEQRKVPKGIAGGRYIVPGNRIMSVVRLSEEAMTEWAEREGIVRVRNRVRTDMLAQTLNMVEILIRLRHERLLYDDWDMMLPQNSDEGLHAWLIKREDEGLILGVFLLPTRLTQAEEGKKGFIFQGTLHRVIQNSTVANTLFLVTREYYATALRALATMEKAGRRFYLLPLESFMAEPWWYLNAIVSNEHIQRQSLVEQALVYEGKQTVPARYDFHALLQFNSDRYRFVDTYVNGSIDRVRNWLKFTIGYQVQNTGHVAGADVYVYDDTMREGLEKVLRTKDRQSKETSIVEVHPWLDGLITPDVLTEHDEGNDNKALVDVDDLPDDESWLKYFNV